MKGSYGSILAKGKPCKDIIMGEYDGKQAAFLIQNMFPVTEKYLVLGELI